MSSKPLTKQETEVYSIIEEYVEAMKRAKGRPPERILVTKRQWDAYRRIHFTGLKPEEVANLQFEGIPVVYQ